MNENGMIWEVAKKTKQATRQRRIIWMLFTLVILLSIYSVAVTTELFKQRDRIKKERKEFNQAVLEDQFQDMVVQDILDTHWILDKETNRRVNIEKIPTPPSKQKK